jgi:predicted aspartyl protease
MQKFKIADGSIIDKPVIIIKSLKIGDIEVKNIKASVGDLNSDLLLGQSFQKRFKILKIDNISNELIIEK